MSNFVKVYRGSISRNLRAWADTPDREAEGFRTGIHWTSDPIVAHHFATYGQLATPQHNHPDNLLPVDEDHKKENDGSLTRLTRAEKTARGDGFKSSPTVLEGWAHKSSIIRPRSLEWRALAERYQIYDPSADEQQITIRPGSTVRVSKVHLIGSQFDVKSFGIPRPLTVRHLHEISPSDFAPGAKSEDVFDEDTYKEIYGQDTSSKGLSQMEHIDKAATGFVRIK